MSRGDHRAALAALAALAACARPAPDARAEVEAITDRAWRAHDLVIAAGERAPTCPAAGAAMQAVLALHRPAFVAALALDRDRDRLALATAFLEAHADRYADLDVRMEALAERCAADPSVQAAFDRMASP